MPTVAEVITRWDTFLASIYERFTTVMSEAQAGCAQLLVDNDYDTQAFGVAWGAMENRAKQLGSKLSDTWDEKVSPMFDEADAEPGIEARERVKLSQLLDRMEVETEGMRVRVFADAARAVWQRAVTEAPPHLACSQCGAPLQVPPTLSAVNVDCPHCRAVVTYEPGMRLRQIEHFCVHPLSEEASWQQWIAKHQAEKALHDSRGETIELLKAFEHAQIEYWRAYLGARARMLPDKAAALEQDLRGKMQYWYDLVDRSGAWIAAGRPKALA